MGQANEMPQILLKKTEPADLETLFLYQLDEDAAHMAAFVNENWKDRKMYLDKWNKLLKDGANIKTIYLGDKIVGSISTWYLGDELQVSYGIAKEYWNKGITTRALQQFLTTVPERPLYGRVAFDNAGSARVLVNCGFKKTGEDQLYAHARKKEIGEIIYMLEG
jgi:ribosomal-protein-alanine N-acetyltransferase